MLKLSFSFSDEHEPRARQPATEHNFDWFFFLSLIPSTWKCFHILFFCCSTFSYFICLFILFCRFVSCGVCHRHSLHCNFAYGDFCGSSSAATLSPINIHLQNVQNKTRHSVGCRYKQMKLMLIFGFYKKKSSLSFSFFLVQFRRSLITLEMESVLRQWQFDINDSSLK